MEAAQAISLVTEWILWRDLDYPTEGLEADRFEAGWSVYAPVDVDESDPMAFLDMPVGRSVFLVGDSGRIEEVSSSVPPQQAEAEFTARELAAQEAGDDSGESEFIAELERQFHPDGPEGATGPSSFTIAGAPPEEGALDLGGSAGGEELQPMDLIVRQLAQLGPAEWDTFSAEFAFTISSEIAQLRFSSDDRTDLVSVPQSVALVVRGLRELAAQSPDGPWWRLLLTVTNRGETTVAYDYGDDPFPDDQLVASEHYRNDVEAYPRERIPVWLAGYIGGPATQGRDPQRAAAAVADDTAAGSTAEATADVPAVDNVWARWAVLSAVYAGIGSGLGPRINPGYAWYENDRSGSTLYVLPGDRAVLSGGKWNSGLLDAAYNGGEPLPDLYTGAPAWVNDSVLSTRNRNGLLTFCFWSMSGQWYRATTDTSGELDAAIPPILTPEATIQAMTSQTGPGTEDQCEALLTAAANRSATPDDVAAVFAAKADSNVAAAINELSLAGLLAT